MPTYEYRCNNCGRVSSIFFRSFSHVADPSCPHCQSPEMSRLISRVSIVRSHNQRVMDIDADRMLSGLDKKDKGSMVRWAKGVGRELDDELGSRFQEMAERVEGGEEHFGLTVDGDHTFRYQIAEAQARAQGMDVEPSDPWAKSPSAPNPKHEGFSEV